MKRKSFGLPMVCLSMHPPISLALLFMLTAPLLLPQLSNAAVVNGDFETGNLSSWNEFGAQDHNVENVTPHGGSYSLKLYQSFSGANNFNGVYQEQAVTAGEDYDFTGYLRNGNGSGDYLGANNAAFMKIEWYTAASGLISDYEHSPANGGGINSSTAQDNQWLYNSFTKTAPGTAAKVRIIAIHTYIGTGFEGGSSWFDDLDIEAGGGGGGSAVPEPTTLSLLLAAGCVLLVKGRRNGPAAVKE